MIKRVLNSWCWFLTKSDEITVRRKKVRIFGEKKKKKEKGKEMSGIISLGLPSYIQKGKEL